MASMFVSHPLMRWAIVFTGYLVSAKLGLALASEAATASAIWPPTGVALAAILLYGMGIWPAILLAATVSNLLNALNHGQTLEGSFELSVLIALGNTAGPVLVAWILKRGGFQRNISRLHDVGLLFLASILGATITSTNGVVSLYAILHLPMDALPGAWLTWWIGDALGFVGFGPILFITGWRKVAWRELVLPMGLTVAAVGLVSYDPLQLVRWVPTIYLTLLPLIWLGVRGGPHAVTLGYLAMALMLVLATNAGQGPMAEGRYQSPLVALASFLGVSAFLAHLVGVSSSHWRTLVQEAQALAAADERFRILFKYSSDAHLLFGASGIIDCNQATIDLLRCADKAQVMNLHPAVLSPEFQPDGRASAEKSQEMDRLAREKGHHRFEWLHRRMDGTDILVEVTLTPVQLGGEPMLLVVWHDLTIQKRREEELERAKEAAESTVRMKGEFLSVMSHELRTPLNGVIGMVELMQDGQLDAEQREQVDIIKSCSRHLLTLINDILDVSRMEAGGIEVERIPVDIRSLTGEVVSLLKPQAEAKKLAMTIEVEPGIPGHIVGDPARIRQILYNLVGNALKFTDEGGVGMRVGWSQGTLSLSIEDTGIGMTPETAGRLFQPFTQADSTMVRRFGGTGLGLVISKRLANLMGGDIRVSSILGKGSAFTCIFPAAEIEHSIPEAPPLPTKTLVLNGRQILVVEDNSVNQIVARRMLERFGAQVQIVSDGQQALESLSAHAVDLVLMDCQMPVMDGLVCTRALRAKGLQVPIIAMTASGLTISRQDCLDAGMNDVLAKPISTEDVARILGHYLGHG